MKVNTQCLSSCLFFLLILLGVLNSTMAEEKKEELPTQSSLVFQRPIGFVADAAVASDPKTRWPELLGSTPEEAEPKIKLDMPRVQIQVVPPGYGVTTDYNTHRVRLYINASRKIIRTPKIG